MKPYLIRRGHKPERLAIEGLRFTILAQQEIGYVSVCLVRNTYKAISPVLISENYDKGLAKSIRAFIRDYGNKIDSITKGRF